MTSANTCGTCHLTTPCWCDGTPAHDVHRPTTTVPAPQTPARRRRAVVVHLPARATTTAPPTRDDGTCPLSHRDDAAPHLPPDRYVCPACTGRLRALLTDLPGLMGDLDVALTRQARFTARVGSRAVEQRVPFAPPAADAMFVTRNAVLANVEWVAGIRGHAIPDTWSTVAEYLDGALAWIAQHPDGAQVIDEVTAALVQARRAIDRPAERRYVGRCGALIETLDVDGTPEPLTCPQQLYAYADRADVTCPCCGTTWDVHARQDAMLAELRDHLLPAADIARAVDGLGVDLTVERIWQWKRRGVLAPTTADGRGRPLYRVGDVLDVVADRVGRSSA